MEDFQQGYSQRIIEETLPETVELVAGQIFNHLKYDLNYEFVSNEISDHSVDFVLDDDNPLSIEMFDMIANEYKTYSVTIRFNPDTQTIVVEPMKN